MDRELIERVRRLSNFGFDCGIVRDAAATNAKLNEYAAAVGLAQLKRWPAVHARRRSVWETYAMLLSGLRGVRTPAAKERSARGLLRQLPRPARQVANVMAKAGIETRRWYLPSVTRHPAFRNATVMSPSGDEILRTVMRLETRLLGLPFHGFLEHNEIARSSMN